jgi:hypothetical protein
MEDDMPAIVNLLKNPDFEEGTTNWTLYCKEDVADVSFATTDKAYKGSKAAQVILKKWGNNRQLYQANFPLKANTAYYLGFVAKATMGYKVEVHVHRHEGGHHENFGLNGYVPNLTADWQEFSVYFTTTGFTGETTDTRLRFQFDNAATKSCEYAFDSICLAEVKVPETIEHMRILGSGDFKEYNAEASLFLGGDFSHYIKARHGHGIRIGTWRAPDAITLRQETGRVGVGTTTPNEKLHVVGNELVQGPYPFGFTKYGDNAEAVLYLGDSKHYIKAKHGTGVQIGTRGAANALTVQQGTGMVGIGTSTPEAKLHVKGNIIATDVLLRNADCAEEFSISETETIEPGTVMVLDQGDTLQQCRKDYDRKVVGVVSGAGDYKPALLLDRQTDQTNRLPIALMGKVYCKVDARYGSVEVGDLLTTSLTPGYAMKATDPGKAFGAILGKALQELESGMGLIPILVTLQ